MRAPAPDTDGRCADAASPAMDAADSRLGIAHSTMGLADWHASQRGWVTSVGTLTRQLRTSGDGRR